MGIYMESKHDACRYSSFLIMYPTGISSELGLIYIALEYIKVLLFSEHIHSWQLTSKHINLVNDANICLCTITAGVREVLV
jgi:hypothetical protein